MQDVARIVVGLEAAEVAEEVMHFLDRTGRARVVATAGDTTQLAEAVRQLEPDAVVASPGLVRSPRELGRSVLLTVDTAESVASLRKAIRAGARGFYVWPADRDDLAREAGRILPPPEREGSKRALVVAVWGPRGGCGTTFLATHLAAAFARRNVDTALVDLDLSFADVSAALGSPSGVRTLIDALPLIEELSPAHMDELLWKHEEGGFRALLAPEDPEAAQDVRALDVRAALGVLGSSVDVVVLHLPRAVDEIGRAALLGAQRVLVVLTLDVLSFRAAKRAFGSLPPALVERCAFVVNRSARGEIMPKDVQAVFGREADAVLPVNGAVRETMDRARLLPPRHRISRSLDRLARKLLEKEAS